MRSLSLEQRIQSTLQVASAMCFIGHGAFGIITKPIWCNYFGLFGINHNMAYFLMPILGTVDILLGLSMLLYPTKAIALWLVIWGFTTAMLRPVSGEPFAELIERAGNYGAPLAFLMLTGSGGTSLKGWFTPIDSTQIIYNATKTLTIICLRVSAFFMLLGHGCLNLIEKKGLITEYTSIGLSNPAGTAHLIGVLEILAACIVLIRPVRSVLVVFLIWKMMSELFYPHWELFEWVERGGSYGVLLALWFGSKIKISFINRKKSINQFDILY